MTRKAKYTLGLAIAILLWCGVNAWEYSRPTACCDFVYFYGLPFVFLREGGFASARCILWRGMLEDILVTLFVGLAFGFLLARFGKRL
jgi:hypothetical protein